MTLDTMLPLVGIGKLSTGSTLIRLMYWIGCGCRPIGLVYWTMQPSTDQAAAKVTHAQTIAK